MAWFKEPDFKDRQKATTQARKAALEKFRTKAADPAAAERQQSRAASAAERAEVNQFARSKRLKKKARDAEAAMQAARDAAMAAERAAAEKAELELAKQAEQKGGARRPLCCPQVEIKERCALVAPTETPGPSERGKFPAVRRRSA